VCVRARFPLLVCYLCRAKYYLHIGVRRYVICLARTVVAFVACN
jgi:hypothetical protein